LVDFFFLAAVVVVAPEELAGAEDVVDCCGLGVLGAALAGCADAVHA